MKSIFYARDFFGTGQNTEINQGTVFIGAYAEDYKDCVNYGILITARCDIAQDKAKKYSYLPLISLSDWMAFDFVELLRKRVEKSAQNNLVTAMENIGGSELLLKTYSLEIIKEKFSNEGKESARRKFYKACEKLALIENSQSIPTDTDTLKELTREFNGEAKQILNDLISQNLSGFYFIDDVAGGGPHVAILREVHHLQRKTATALREGVRIEDQNIKYPEDTDLSHSIGTITSPFIEHLMQKFSELFTRIGIEDPDTSAASMILSRFNND